MIKTDVKQYFDLHAANWDAEMIKDDNIIAEILRCAGISQGKHVLDVACGTGVLFPYYEALGAEPVGVDISDEMCRIASEKFPDKTVICADVEQYDFNEKYDAAVVYNALPHFSDPEALVAVLANLLKDGATLTIAHGMSREAIIRRHSGISGKISIELPEADDLASIMSKYLTVTTVVSDDSKYIVCGKK